MGRGGRACAGGAAAAWSGSGGRAAEGPGRAAPCGMDEDVLTTLKILIIGESGVGKSR